MRSIVGGGGSGQELRSVGRHFCHTYSGGFHEVGGCVLELVNGRELRYRTWIELAAAGREFERV